MNKLRHTTYFWAGWFGVACGLHWAYWAGRAALEGFWIPPLFAMGLIPIVLGVLFIRRSSRPDLSA